eukprot:gene3708-14981_t
MGQQGGKESTLVGSQDGLMSGGDLVTLVEKGFKKVRGRVQVRFGKELYRIDEGQADKWRGNGGERKESSKVEKGMSRGQRC